MTSISLPNSKLTELSRRVLRLTDPMESVPNLGWHLRSMCSVPDNHPYLIGLAASEDIHPDDLDWYAISSCATNSDDFNDFKRYIKWPILSSNPNVIEFLFENIHRVDWVELSGNPGAFTILSKYHHKIHWSNLCGNPNAVSLLETCPPEKLDLYKLATNNNAVHILERYANSILNLDIWAILAIQPSQEAVDLVISHLFDGMNLVQRGGGFIPAALAENPLAIGFVEQQLAIGQFHWEDIARSLCRNPEAIHLLEKHVDNPIHASHIDWNVLAENPFAKNLVLTHLSSVPLRSLAFNKSKWALDIISSRMDEVDADPMVWDRLSGNSFALPILNRHPNKVVVDTYLRNIPACQHTWWHDYAFIRERNYDIHEEMTAMLHHPYNLANGNLANWGFMEEVDEEDEDT